MKKIASLYKEAEIYFHQDLDGVTSALAMKSYLESYGIAVINTHIIQYGSLEFNITPPKIGSLPVMVDFAHVKDIFIIVTDHHDKQEGYNSKMSVSFKKASSNVETISEEISNNDIFSFVDIQMIKTVDSANFNKYKLTPQQIQNCLFSLNKKRSAGNNRFLLGLTVNRLLLALKNKRITVNSLKNNNHYNKNILECLVLDSKPSIYSLYLNLSHYMKNAISYEWNTELKTYHDHKKLPTKNQLQFNLYNYILSRKEYIQFDGNIIKNKDIEWDELYKIIKQYDIGSAFKSGSYDRYVPFVNFPESNYLCTIYKTGLIQISENPFKQKTYNVNLGDITKELFKKHKDILNNFKISVSYIKKINEIESEKLKKKFINFTPIGFSFKDLMTFYDDCVHYFPQKNNEVFFKLDLRDKLNPIIIQIENIMNKLYCNWTDKDKEDMSHLRINGLNILEKLSGGHSSITNIQGFNFLDERRDVIQNYFSEITIPYCNGDGINLHRYINTYDDLMIFFTNEYLSILKSKMNFK